MLAHQRDQLLGGNEKRNHINETEESQNNKSRQPIGISVREKLLEEILIIHSGTNLRKRPTPNAQRPTPRQGMPGGRIELPTKGL